MVLLKPMKPTSLVLGGVHKVEGIVADIVYHIADQEESPVYCVQNRVIYYDYPLETHLDRQVVENYEERHRQHQSVSEIGNMLRVVGKHMVHPVGEEVAISYDPVVGENVLGVENEPMQNVLDKAEVEQSSDGDQNEGDQVETFP